MKQVHQFTALIEREGDWFVALCPELDIASQGKTVEEARCNLIEALELFFQEAGETERKELNLPRRGRLIRDPLAACPCPG